MPSPVALHSSGAWLSGGEEGFSGANVLKEIHQMQQGTSSVMH